MAKDDPNDIEIPDLDNFIKRIRPDEPDTSAEGGSIDDPDDCPYAPIKAHPTDRIIDALRSMQTDPCRMGRKNAKGPAATDSYIRELHRAAADRLESLSKEGDDE